MVVRFHSEIPELCSNCKVVDSVKDEDVISHKNKSKIYTHRHCNHRCREPKESITFSMLQTVILRLLSFVLSTSFTLTHGTHDRPTIRLTNQAHGDTKPSTLHVTCNDPATPTQASESVSLLAQEMESSANHKKLTPPK
jgi:hypothetical protein